jgi:mono/diheme cytochrome c family protein
MSEEQKTPPTWGKEAQGLAGRFALTSGVVITFILFGLIVIPAIVRERQAPERTPSDQPAAASLGWLDQADAPASRGRDLPPVDPATVMTPNPKLLARGEVLFKQNCTSCHGDTGRGDGPAIATLNPKPRNFTQSQGWSHGYRITDIFATITNGVKGTGMASFEFILPADRMALVHHVRSLGTFDHGAEDQQAQDALANQFRSKGVHIPNRIPVSLAMKNMLAERAAIPELKLPPPEAGTELATWVRSAVADPVRAAHTLAAIHEDDPAALARTLAAGAPANGFAPSVATMNNHEWQEIIRALFGIEKPLPASSKKEP